MRKVDLRKLLHRVETAPIGSPELDSEFESTFRSVPSHVTRSIDAAARLIETELTLAEAVAKAGGLRDAEADPASVFLYRGETREVAEAMGIDCSKFQGPIIPVIYNINFRNPGSYFLATTFEMRNKDVIQVSNSVSVEATKFLTYVRNHQRSD
jgi:hypothetical protein